MCFKLCKLHVLLWVIFKKNFKAPIFETIQTGCEMLLCSKTLSTFHLSKHRCPYVGEIFCTVRPIIGTDWRFLVLIVYENDLRSFSKIPVPGSHPQRLRLRSVEESVTLKAPLAANPWAGHSRAHLAPEEHSATLSLSGHIDPHGLCFYFFTKQWLACEVVSRILLLSAMKNFNCGAKCSWFISVSNTAWILSHNCLCTLHIYNLCSVLSIQ